MFNNFAPPDIEEEAKRRQKLIDEMWAEDETEKEDDEKEEN